MKVRLFLHIAVAEPGKQAYHGETVTFDTNWTCFPFAGLPVESGAWQEARVVGNVSACLESGLVSAYMGDERVESKDQLKEKVEMYKFHGWEVVGEN